MAVEARTAKQFAENSDWKRFVSGHDFSRAEKGFIPVVSRGLQPARKDGKVLVFPSRGANAHQDLACAKVFQFSKIAVRHGHWASPFCFRGLGGRRELSVATRASFSSIACELNTR
jgi:hypothetical protein